MRIIKISKNKMESDIIAFFKENPNPPDKGKGGVHDWAEKNGYDKHKVEEAIYRLFSELLT